MDEAMLPQDNHKKKRNKFMIGTIGHISHKSEKAEHITKQKQVMKDFLKRRFKKGTKFYEKV